MMESIPMLPDRHGICGNTSQTFINYSDISDTRQECTHVSRTDHTYHDPDLFFRHTFLVAGCMTNLPISDVTIPLFQAEPPEMSVPAAVTPYRMEMSWVRPTKKKCKNSCLERLKCSAPSGLLLVPANLVTCTRICLAKAVVSCLSM